MKEDRVREAYDEIDFYDYLRVIWRWRWMIAIGVIVSMLAAIPASYLVRSYESQGIMRLSEGPKVTLPDYKIYSTACIDTILF